MIAMAIDNDADMLLHVTRNGGNLRFDLERRGEKYEVYVADPPIAWQLLSGVYSRSELRDQLGGATTLKVKRVDTGAVRTYRLSP